MVTALHQPTQRSLPQVLGLGLLMTVIALLPGRSSALLGDTCPSNPAVADLLDWCVTDNAAVDCPALQGSDKIQPRLSDVVKAPALANGDVIGIFIATDDNITLPLGLDLRIEECHNAEITAADASLPVIKIPLGAGDGDPTNNYHPTTKDILINGIGVIGGETGILVENNSTELKGTRALNNDVGISIDGNTNVVNSSNAENSTFAGIVVTGDNNTVRNSKALNNGTDGFRISDTGSGNLVRSNTADSNNRGFFVAGSSNTLQENRAINNDVDGFQITGGSNTLTKNRAERNKDDGFDVRGTGNRLGNNLATANVDKEFDVVAGNQDLGGNKANGAPCPLPGSCQ